MSLDLSVCIPLHDPETQNEAFLREGLDSLVHQSARPSQVVLTSSTDIHYVGQIVNDYEKFFEIAYEIRKTNGASMNFNNCVALANRTYVQLLCQDDFIKSTHYLSQTYKKLARSGRKWQIAGSRHFEQNIQRFDRRIIPKYSDKLIFGVNTIGAPSVVSFYRTAFIPFDTQLHYMYDCDWYVKMFHGWGKPLVARKDAIGIRIHGNQSTHGVSQLLEEEIEIAKRNHSVSPGVNCKCIDNYRDLDIE